MYTYLDKIDDHLRAEQAKKKPHTCKLEYLKQFRQKPVERIAQREYIEHVYFPYPEREEEGCPLEGHGHGHAHGHDHGHGHHENELMQVNAVA